MGLSATSDNWCRKSDFVIEGNENARKIVDDILCWGATMQELMTILPRCKAIGITLSIKKFKISKEVAFAGYVVKQGAIRPSPERAIALKELPRPENIHELRSFLGLAQQLAGFIPDLSHASEPLRHLLKKEKKWIWSFGLQDAFDAVVKILTCDLILINFDPSKCMAERLETLPAKQVTWVRFPVPSRPTFSVEKWHFSVTLRPGARYKHCNCTV
jgi:hypothetical protein